VVYDERFKPTDCIDLPQKGTEEPYRVYGSVIESYQTWYPGVSVRQEIGLIQAWLTSNPEKQQDDTRGYVLRWLKKAEERTDPEIARKALAESMALLGIRSGSGGACT
jgi:hypothetical protein